MRHVLGLAVPNILPETLGLRAAGRLIWTTVLFVVLLSPVVVALKRQKSKLKATWAQAMAGAVYVWVLMVLAYGSIPHEWLTFANGYLKWDESHFLLTSGQSIGPFNWLNLDVDKRAITDTVATLIYVVLAVANFKMFAAWQRRPEAPSVSTAVETEKVIGTSAFGRPVTVKS